MKGEFLEYIEEQKSKGFIEASRLENTLDSINRYTGRGYTYDTLPEGLYSVFVSMVDDMKEQKGIIESEKLDTYSVKYANAEGMRDEYITKLEPYIDYGIPIV